MRIRRGFLFSGVMCLVQVLVLPTAALALPFAPVVNYPMGPNFDVELGDFNADGITDIATLNVNAAPFTVSSTVTVRLGAANGTFGPAQTSPISTAGMTAVDLAVGDVNGDGRSDLVAAQLLGSFAVALSLGNGTFSPPTVGSGLVRPAGITVADFNHDGKLDVAAAVGGNCCAGAAIALGNGNGTFQPPVTYSLGIPSGGRSVTVGDLNHDGKPDLVGISQFGMGGAGISAILGNGNGTFGPPQVVANPIGIPRSVAIGTLNADAFPDLAVTLSQPDRVGVFLGNGNGTFGPGTTYNVGTGPTDVVIGDLNGDGRNDLAVSNLGSANVSVLLGTGIGIFVLVPAFTVPIGAPASSLAIGNLNGVGLPDLAVSASSNVAVVRNIP